MATAVDVQLYGFKQALRTLPRFHLWLITQGSQRGGIHHKLTLKLAPACRSGRYESITSCVIRPAPPSAGAFEEYRWEFNRSFCTRSNPLVINSWCLNKFGRGVKNLCVKCSLCAHTRDHFGRGEFRARIEFTRLDETTQLGYWSYVQKMEYKQKWMGNAFY